MSEFNLTWRKYGLVENPYFNAPLSIDGGSVSLSNFVGRDSEREELMRVISMGGEIRYMVVGEPGVGKTSLLNFVRFKASKEGFFTPIREIEINKPMSGNEFIILTISAIYDEINRLGVIINSGLLSRLHALYELTQYGELSNDIAKISQLNKHKLIELFREIIASLIPKYKGIIIHYDNLDNFDNLEDLQELLADVRDFLMDKNVIFFFVGDQFLPSVINSKIRLAQIFITPALEVKHLSLTDVRKLLVKRITSLRIDENIPLITPHNDESIELLYRLHNGNIREILNSLSSCLVSISSANTPIVIDEDLLRDILSDKAKRITGKLTTEEKGVLNKMLNKEYITPTELSSETKKSIQNISSKYLPKLINSGAVRLKSAEGRNKYYEITPEIRWSKLERKEEEKIKSKEEKEKKISKIITSTLKDFI